MSRLAALTLALAVMLPPAAAEAQGFTRKESIASPVHAFDPKPDPLDFDLPMPCGAKMVFRLVCTIGTGYLNDVRFDSGCGNECQRNDQAYFEGQRSVGVSGSFSAANLPKPWRDKLAANGVQLCPTGPGQQAFHYFIGKYEVTRFQWKAVTQDACPPAGQPLAADDPLPVVSVSWFDAVDFGRRYTEWLLREHPDALPYASPNEPGTIRLPTEVEWEFAARGGQAVKIDPTKDPLFPMAAGQQPQDFGVFRFPGRSRDPELSFIASRAATPLGLYDTVGNAAEMVLDTFAFSFAKRRHGASGGFIRKGGSYLTEIDQVMPGRRDEKAFFDKKGPLRQMDLGMRVALAGVAMPNNAERASAVDAEWKHLRQSPDIADPSGQAKTNDLLGQIDKLKSVGASRDEEHNRRLAALRTTIEQNNAELREQRAESVKGLIRSAVFTAETVKNYHLRKSLLEDNLKDSEAEYKKEKRPAVKQELQNNVEATKRQIGIFEEAIRESVSFYISQLRSASAGGRELTDSQVASMRGDLQRQGVVGKLLNNRLNTVTRHIDVLAGGGQLQIERTAKDLSQ